MHSSSEKVLCPNEIFKFIMIYMYSEIITFIRGKPTLFEGSLYLDREEIGQSVDRHCGFMLLSLQTLQKM